ncbi:MAG: DUF882 domain-containing protein [Polyangiaceae bacterium]|jgi:uncharacterized protein YcbK (DUF882 family)
MSVARSAIAIVGLFAWLPAWTARAQGPTRHRRDAGGATAQASKRLPAYKPDAKQALVGWHAPSSDPPRCDASGRPMLSLKTINRAESLSVAALSDDGGFSSLDLDRVAHLLRAASGDEHPIDPRTLSLVYRIERHFDVAEIRVVSGYRDPKAGSNSNHGKGRAIDLVVPGIPDEEAAQFVRSLGFVGVGIYPTSQFVHVDIRPRSYFWVDFSGPHTKNRERGILGELASKSDAAAIERGERPIEPFLVEADVDAAIGARGLASSEDSRAAEDDEDDEH